MAAKYEGLCPHLLSITAKKHTNPNQLEEEKVYHLILLNDIQSLREAKAGT